MTFYKAFVGLITLMAFGVALAAPPVKVIALFSGKALLQLGTKQKILREGESLDGVLLKSASARGAIVVVDDQEMKLNLNQSIAGNFKKPVHKSVKIYPDSMGMFYTSGYIDRKATRFLVDTGATFVTLSGDKAKSLSIDFKRGKPGTTQTASAIVPVWQVRLKSVEVGGITVRDVEATVIEGDQPVDVLLGNSFLRHTRIQHSGAVLEIHHRF